MNKIKICLLFFSLIFHSIIVGVNGLTENFSSCSTPGNELGLCIPLRSCQSLFSLILKNKELSSSDRLYLSGSQCDYVVDQPFVCCPPFNAPPVVGDIRELPRPDECGIDSSDRIFRGNVTDLTTFPWMALLEYSTANGTKGYSGVGILISKRFVLTAAHCLTSTWNITAVRLGEHDLLSDPDCEVFETGTNCNLLAVVVPISETIIHEHYDSQSKNQANDIALLKLQSDVAYSDFIKPICLPTTFEPNNFNYTSLLNDAGWYRETREHSTKQIGFIEMVNSSQCNSIYNNIGVSVHETQICGMPRPVYKSCLRLSGSPLMSDGRNVGEIYGQWYLVGVESFGAPMCEHDGWPNVYTRTSSYIDWIESKINS